MRDVHCVLNVKLARLAVKPQTSVVVYPVCSVRVLLDLGEQYAFAYRVERAGFYKEEVALFDRDLLHKIGQRAVGYRLSELLAGQVFFEAEQKMRARLAVENIP